MYNGVGGKAPEAGELSENFCFKSIALHSVRLLITVSYRKNAVAECTSCWPIILLGEQLLAPRAVAVPAAPVSALMAIRNQQITSHELRQNIDVNFGVLVGNEH